VEGKAIRILKGLKTKKIKNNNYSDLHGTAKRRACCSVASFMTLGPRRLFGETPRCHWSVLFGSARQGRTHDNVAARAVKTVWTVFRGARDSRALGGETGLEKKSIFPAPTRRSATTHAF